MFTLCIGALSPPPPLPPFQANMSGFKDGTRSAGDDASSTYTSNFKNTITSMKRLIGLQFTDARVTRELAALPFKAVKNEVNGGVSVEVMYDNAPTIVSIEQATAMMLCHMSDICKDNNQVRAVPPTHFIYVYALINNPPPLLLRTSPPKTGSSASPRTTPTPRSVPCSTRAPLPT